MLNRNFFYMNKMLIFADKIFVELSDFFISYEYFDVKEFIVCIVSYFFHHCGFFIEPSETVLQH